MTDTPPDWVLIEAAKRSYLSEDLPSVRARYWTFGAFRALCDMIQKYEQPPVDRKLLCAREAFKMFGENPSPRLGLYIPVQVADDYAIRAIELWEEGFGK